MPHSFAIPGMTCSGCERTVTRVLSGIEGVTAVKTELQPYSRVEITMTKHLETDLMNAELAKVAKGKYVLLPDNNGVRTEVRLKDSTSNDSPTHAVAE
jgi:copper chaperone CopZ